MTSKVALVHPKILILKYKLQANLSEVDCMSTWSPTSIVINTITPLSEDKEVVFLITLASLVLHIPVVLSSNLVVIPEDEGDRVSPISSL